MAEDKDEQAPMNKTLEDCLAYAVTEMDREMVIEAWLRLGVEYYVQQVGRRSASDHLTGLRQFVETAQPSRPWPE